MIKSDNKVTVKKGNIRGWEGFRLTAGKLSVGVAPSIGGRIISLIYEGQELFFVQPEYEGETYDLSTERDLAKAKKAMGFRVWGGDKTWISPQESWLEFIPPLDLDAGAYQCLVEGNRVVMTSPVCRETGIKISREIIINSQDTIVLNQTLVNEGSHSVERGIWNVTQIKRPFTVCLPVPESRICVYPGMDLEHDIGHKIRGHSSHGLSEILCDDATHFKVGTMIDDGVLTTLIPGTAGTIAFKRTFSVDRKARYPHKAVVEVYNSQRYSYGEVEVHGSAKILAPGEKISHEQTWSFELSQNDTGPS